VTDKLNPVMVARETYEDVYYTHQGWLTDDHSHLFLDDEIDELSGPSQNTRSKPAASATMRLGLSGSGTYSLVQTNTKS
jgi:hypothetical protein